MEICFRPSERSSDPVRSTSRRTATNHDDHATTYPFTSTTSPDRGDRVLNRTPVAVRALARAALAARPVGLDGTDTEAPLLRHHGHSYLVPVELFQDFAALLTDPRRPGGPYRALSVGGRRWFGYRSTHYDTPPCARSTTTRRNARPASASGSGSTRTAGSGSWSSRCAARTARRSSTGPSWARATTLSTTPGAPSSPDSCAVRTASGRRGSWPPRRHRVPARHVRGRRAAAHLRRGARRARRGSGARGAGARRVRAGGDQGGRAGAADGRGPAPRAVRGGPRRVRQVLRGTRRAAARAGGPGRGKTRCGRCFPGRCPRARATVSR